MLLLILASMGPASAAEPLWFYPDESDAIEVVSQDGSLWGAPLGRTGQVVVHTAEPGALSRHPDVVAVRALRLPDTVLVTARDGADEFVLSRELRGWSGVDWAHPDLLLPLEPRSLTADAYSDDQWHLENTGQWGGLVDADINAAQAWQYATGEGGMVAVIDSGVDAAHPDLDVIVGYDYVSKDEDSAPEPGDSSGPHGTAAAGLAAAMGDNDLGVSGVARGSSVYSIRLISALGSASTSDVGDSFVEATDAGAWVISNSWGYADCYEGTLPAVMRNGLNYAEEQGRGGLGAAMVFSAGNDGCDNSDEVILSHPSVIGVGATDDHDRHIGYSSYGTSTDIAAPSGAVLTTDISGSDEGYGNWNGDYDYTGTFSGTSASAPIVSGVLLLMFDANPRLTAAQAREVLCETAEPVDAEGGEWDGEGRSKWFGCGRVNAGAAVAAVANDAPGAPVPWELTGEATLDRVMLGWEAVVDPDGDRLVYEVDWSLGDSLDPAEDEGGDDTGGAEVAEVHTVQTEDPWLDLTSELDGTGVITWRVRAVDAWGAGEDSATAHLNLVEHEESVVLAEWREGESKGCASASRSAPSGGRALFPLLLGMLALMGLRRRG